MKKPAAKTLSYYTLFSEWKLETDLVFSIDSFLKNISFVGFNLSFNISETERI
jgi:hypothetical protein